MQFPNAEFCSKCWQWHQMQHQQPGFRSQEQLYYPQNSYEQYYADFIPPNVNYYDDYYGQPAPHQVPSRYQSNEQQQISGEALQIQNVLKKHPVVVFSFTYCPGCKALKKKFNQNKIKYFALEVDLLPDKPAFIDELEKISGIRTAPQVFVKGKFIGDGSTTRNLVDNGEFKKRFCK